MRIRPIVLLVVILAGCSSGPVPRGVLPPDRMQKIVYDLIRIDEFMNNFVIKDSAIDAKKKRSSLYDEVFKVNNTNRKEFYSSYKYYQEHPDVQKEVFDSLHESLNRKVEVGRMKPGNPVPVK